MVSLSVLGFAVFPVAVPSGVATDVVGAGIRELPLDHDRIGLLFVARIGSSGCGQPIAARHEKSEESTPNEEAEGCPPHAVLAPTALRAACPSQSSCSAPAGREFTRR